MTVLDLSHYDLPTLDPACFKAAGVTGVILAVYSPTDAPNKMRQAAVSCRAAGIDILGFYGFIYFGNPAAEMRDTLWAIRLAQEFGVRRVWLDCETDAVDNGWGGVRPSPSRRVEAIRRAVTEVERAGLTAGIYTGSWWWDAGTGGSTEFAHLPLWHSAYGPNGTAHAPVTEVAYGGWTRVAVHQYASAIELCGRVRDHNYVFEEEDGMTAEQAAQLQALWDALVGRGNPAGVERLEAWNANGNSLLDGFTIEQKKLAGHKHFLATPGETWAAFFRPEDETL